MNQPTPPPGMRILSYEELKNPLPMDAVYWSDAIELWVDSNCRGFRGDEAFTYATATPPPTDWRKMCEELVVSARRYKEFCKPHCVGGMDAKLALDVALTRAKAALEESK